MRMSMMATSGRWARTLRTRSSPSPASPTTSMPASSSSRTTAARTSNESSAITARLSSAPAAARLAVEVEDELDRGVGGGVVERLPGGGAFEGDAEDRRPESARLRRGRGTDLPPAGDEALGDGALALQVQPRERLPDARREIGAAAHERRRLDEVEQCRRLKLGLHARAHVAARA